MKTKIIKISITVICLLICIALYKLPISSLWRNYNNGVRAFNEMDYNRAAIAFNRASNASNDPILKYNWCISLWSDIMKKTQDLKITTINDTSITTFEKNKLISKIEKANHAIHQILSEQNLNDKLQAKLYYAQGKLYMLVSQSEFAKGAFMKAMSKDKNFSLPLVEMIKSNSSEPVAELLLHITKTEPVSIEKKWKPF